MNKEDLEIRAARAKQLLEDEVLGEAINGLIQDALLKALMASLADQPKCVEAVASIQAASAFQDKLKEYVTAGKAAERKPFKVA